MCVHTAVKALKLPAVGWVTTIFGPVRITPSPTGTFDFSTRPAEAVGDLKSAGRPPQRRVTLPQALRIILPPMTSDFVALFKDTSVVSVIAVAELTKRYQTAAQSSLKYVELGLMTAALYLIMSVPLGILSRWLEKRWGKGVS